jgi:hypothetical protein
METYQERVIEEKNELDGKIEKLRNFIASDPFGVGLVQKKWMRRQELIMELYSDVLAERIAAFS